MTAKQSSFKIAELEKFAKKVIKKYPYINSGGCCVFAALIGKYLEKHVTAVRVRVRNAWMREGSRNLDTIRNKITENTLRQWNRNGVDFTHVMVEFDYRGRTYLYDATVHCA